MIYPVISIGEITNPGLPIFSKAICTSALGTLAQFILAGLPNSVANNSELPGTLAEDEYSDQLELIVISHLQATMPSLRLVYL